MKKFLMCVAGILAMCCTASAGPNLEDNWGDRVAKVKFGILEAIDRGLKEAGSGVMFAAELEPKGKTLVYSVDIAQGDKMCNVVIGAISGEVVENVVEGDDQSGIVATCKKVSLKEGIQAALKKCPGTPFFAELIARSGKPGVVVNVVENGQVKTVVVDGTTGEASVVGAADRPKSAGKDDVRKEVLEELEREFTKTFPEDKADLGPMGRNNYFIMEPGYYWVFEGTEGGKTVRVTYTVLKETKKIDGVECRAIESREVEGGELAEITLDYYAISRKTNNVYYFGEEVDIYKDGKVEGHEGTWLAGQNGSTWGLMVPAVPLLGARHYQEIAPGIALDRVEVVSLTEVVKTPAGTFKNVMKQEETNPEEPGHIDYKYYAPGVGMIKEEANSLLVKWGKE